MIITPSNKVLLLGWESVSESRERGFFDFEFITWMAWTWQTALFFVFIAFTIYKSPFSSSSKLRPFPVVMQC